MSNGATVTGTGYVRDDDGIILLTGQPFAQTSTAEVTASAAAALHNLHTEIRGSSRPGPSIDIEASRA